MSGYFHVLLEEFTLASRVPTGRAGAVGAMPGYSRPTRHEGALVQWERSSLDQWEKSRRPTALGFYPAQRTYVK